MDFGNSSLTISRLNVSKHKHIIIFCIYIFQYMVSEIKMVRDEKRPIGFSNMPSHSCRHSAPSERDFFRKRSA